MDAASAERELEEVATLVDLDRAGLGYRDTIRRGALTSEPAAATRPPSLLPPLDVAKRSPSGVHEGSAELELLSVLGIGGMGEVWLAHQRALDRQVAVKTLRGEAFAPEAADALLVEALATGALEHPSIVPVHALGAGPGGAPLLVMKRVDGATVHALIQDSDHPAWPALERRHGDRLRAYVEILMRVADALQFAHTHGLVHRDVKPENIMVGRFGETYLLDWGVAFRRLPEGDTSRPADARKVAIVGTPAFMSPELARGCEAQIDARSDVYLLGATLHTILTGTAPHRGETLFAVLLSALLSEPHTYEEDVPDELASLAGRCMSVEPSERPESALAVRDALAGFVRHQSSLHLAREADERLLELGAELDEQALRSHATTLTLAEARFGFIHALKEWPENPLALSGLQRTYRALVETELARGNPDSAAAHLSLLEEPDPLLSARLESLRASAEERELLADQARQENIEADPTLHGKSRAGLVAAVAIIPAVGLALFLSESGHRPVPPVWVSTVIDTAVFAFVGGSALVFRKALLANRWGRQAVGLFLIASVVALATGAVTLLRGDDLYVDVPYRTLVFSALFAGSALYVSPRLWIAAGWGLFAAVLSAFWPPFTLPGFVSTLLLAIALMVAVSVGRRQTAKRDPSQR